MAKEQNTKAAETPAPQATQTKQPKTNPVKKETAANVSVDKKADVKKKGGRPPANKSVVGQPAPAKEPVPSIPTEPPIVTPDKVIAENPAPAPVTLPTSSTAPLSPAATAPPVATMPVATPSPVIPSTPPATSAQSPVIGQPVVKDESLEPVSEFKIGGTTADGKELDLQKVFICKAGAQFLAGSITIAMDNTNIQRVDEIYYSISGTMPENQSPFKVPFESIDKQEADELWAELLDYEKNPDKYIVKPAAQAGTQPAANQPPPPTPPVSQPGAPQQGMPAAPPPSQNPHGQAITNVNINDLIKNAPAAPPPPASPSNPVGMGTASDISHIINNQQNAETTAYAHSILDHIKGSWKIGAWGGVPISDVEEFINGPQCSKDYKYELRNEERGYFLLVMKNQLTVRVPASEDEFLPIK